MLVGEAQRDKMQEDPVALIVNAGGQSRRMGRVKALLPMPQTGTPLILHIVRRLLPSVTDQVIVVANDPHVVAAVNQLRNVTIVQDRWARGGALGGLATGLAACAGWAMVVACDMPFVDAAIFAQLAAVAERVPNADAVIPRVGGAAQPFHGLWHRRALPIMTAQVEAGELGVQAALATLNVVWVDEDALGISADSRAFYNVNQPEEWAALQSILSVSSDPYSSDP
jgi:molybdopterin-guanine dinucleotide biosynthesis protein A